MQRLIYILSLLLLGINSLKGQEVNEVRLGDFLERLPKPLATQDETFAMYGSQDRMDNALGAAFKEINGSLDLIYAPLLDRFRRRVAEKTPTTGLSKEEQTMLKAFQINSKGFSGDAEKSMFRFVMESNRPLISSGKLSWTKLSPSASASIQKLYQQIKAVEGQMDWEGFAEQAYNYRPVIDGPDDEKTLAVVKKFEADFEKLPKKKVKIMEGFYDDVADPEKTISLYKQYQTDWLQAVEQKHQKRYKWWMQQYEKLAAISKQVDALAIQAASDGDHAIEFPIADLQGRTWESWQRLTMVTQALFMDAVIEASFKLQIEEGVKLYQKYKEGSE